eukprot:s1150_g15.t1
MSLEPVQSNPSEVESKGSRGWIFMLPFCGNVVQHAQAAALGLAPYRPRVKLWFLKNPAFNSAGFVGVHRLWSSWQQRLDDIEAALLQKVLLELNCGAVLGYGSRKFMIIEFHSLQRTQCPFDETFLNSFQGQAEETLMSQALCHLAVNVFRAHSEQSL